MSYGCLRAAAKRTVHASQTFRGYLAGLTPVQRQLVAIVALGLVIRFVFGLFWTYPRDIASWSLNSENFLMGEGLYGLPGHYYTPVWGYFMAVLTAIAGFIGIPVTIPNPFFDGSQSMAPWYTDLPSMEYALLVKSFLFVVDILVGYVIYRIAVYVRDERTGVVLFAVWFLCPLTIVMSSVRVMFENLEILFMLYSLLMVLERRYAMAGITMGVSLLVKPYGIFLGLLLIGFIYARTRNPKDSVSYVLFTILSMLLLMLPVLISGDLEEAMHWLTARTDNMGSGYNLSLYVIPSLIVISIFATFLIARLGMDDVPKLMCAATCITAMTLIFAGNVQYYLILLPLALLMFSRLSRINTFLLSVMAVLAWVSFTSWSTQLYVSYDFWGSDALMAWGDFVYNFESHLNYDWLKSLTGWVAVIIPFMLLVYRKYFESGGKTSES